MSDSTPQWYDDEAGPLVRLFAMTAGRARSTNTRQTFDLVATVEALSSEDDEPTLPPEQRTILRICRDRPQTVTDIASDSDLPLGVVRVLLGDLAESGHIRVRNPVEPAQLPDTSILREVINGLRAL